MNHKSPPFSSLASSALFAALTVSSLQAAVITDPPVVTSGNRIAPFSTGITHVASGATAESTLEGSQGLCVLQDFSSFSGSKNIVSFSAYRPDISVTGSTGNPVTNGGFLSSAGTAMRIQTLAKGSEYTHSLTIDFGSYNGSSFDGSGNGVLAAGFTLNSTPTYLNATSQIEVTFLGSDGKVLSTQSFAGSMSEANYRIYFGLKAAASNTISSIKIDIASTASGGALIYGLDDLAFTSSPR